MDDTRLNVDVHLNTETARSSLLDMFANIRPIPLAEQIRRESEARLSRPQPTPQQSAFAGSMVPFLVQQNLSYSNMARALGADMSRFGGRIGAAGASAWNAGSSFSERLGLALGNTGATAWNWVSAAPGRIAEAHKRRSLLRDGFSEEQIAQMGIDQRRTDRGIRIASREGLDLSKFLNGAQRSSAEEARDRSNAYRDEQRHNKVIQSLHERGLHDIAERVSRHLDSLKQQRERNFNKFGQFKTDEELSEYSGRRGGPLRSINSTRALLGGIAGSAFTQQMIDAYFATDVNPLDDNWIRRHRRSQLSGATMGAFGGLGLAAMASSLIPGVGPLVALGLAAGGAALGGGLASYTSRERRETDERGAEFRLVNAPRRAEFERTQRLGDWAFRQQLSMRGYREQLKFFDERIAERRFGSMASEFEQVDKNFKRWSPAAARVRENEFEKLRDRLRRIAERQISRGRKGPTDTSEESLSAWLDVLKDRGEIESEAYSQISALRDRRIQEREGLTEEKMKLESRPFLSYVNERSVNDAFSSKGMFVGGAIDVQSVNNNILEELKKCVRTLDSIRNENGVRQPGSFIHGSAIQALSSND